MIELIEAICGLFGMAIEGVTNLIGWIIEEAGERPLVAAVVALSFIGLVCGVVAIVAYWPKEPAAPPVIAAPNIAPTSTSATAVVAPPPVVPAIRQGGQVWEPHPIRDKAVGGAKKLWAKVKDKL